MRDYLKFYIDGAWVDPIAPRVLEVINPATEAVAGHISLGAAADVDRAVAAARKAFASFSLTSREERLDLLRRIAEVFEARQADVAEAITEEMGAPAGLALRSQAGIGLRHLNTAIEVLKTYRFDEDRGQTRIAREPIGVCGLITPWNWPINQMVCKIAPALATGCTVILKPSEIAPFSAQILTEILDQAGVPTGVYNMINGDGPGVGAALSAHPDIDMISFTGSTRAGVEVAKAAAPTVKRVAQELGGKSPYVILPDADLDAAVTGGVLHVMQNTGQSCNAPTRMLVQAEQMERAVAIAKAVAEGVSVGDPNGNAQMGPVISQTQWDKIQGLIQVGIDEGAQLVTGGVGRPEGLETGYYVKPTVFAGVTNTMTIAREEIFGPVLAMLAYDTVEEAVAVGNDTEYGLAAYVWGGDLAKARAVASRLRAGQVMINGAGGDMMAPFGGYKRSGNGREWGDHAFAEFLETKAVIGYSVEAAE
jgi:aldehyde dehydrogenase (NAD+)